MVALLLLAALVFADPAYGRPLKPGDIIEVWEPARGDGTPAGWCLMRIERNRWNGELECVGENVAFDVELLAFCVWRWRGCATCVSNPMAVRI